MTETPRLDGIRTPEDLRSLQVAELEQLAEEIRAFLTETVSRTGGHLASNLGVTELTLALHRTHDFTTDRLLWDVGHQCYVHKLLTGRRAGFDGLRQHGGLSGFPNPLESEQDPFFVGHASTGISTALGLAIGHRLQGSPGRVVTVVGDGSIVGGMAFEALNNAGHAGADLLVILNDNEMSISSTVGAFQQYLTDVRSRPATERVRRDLHQIMRSIPLIGDSLDKFSDEMLAHLKHHLEPTHIFSALGFRYFGPVDGHDLPLLEKELRNLQQLGGPKLLHVVTAKGKGREFAVKAPETFHSPSPFRIEGDRVELGRAKESWSSVLAGHMTARAASDARICAITAAMPSGTGTSVFEAAHPDRFFDVGICEQHAVTFAAGLARSGMRPVACIYATFLQRAYDQMIHDVALQPDLPVLFAIDRAGLVGGDGRMFHGVFDIACLRTVPGMVLMAPRDAMELRQMFDFALTCPGPVAIRYPRGTAVESLAGVPERTLIRLGEAEALRQGTDGTFIAYGRMVERALAVADALAADGLDIGVVNARFAKPLDADMLVGVAAASPHLFTLEDHSLAGGLGSACLEALADRGVQVPVTRFGVPDRFVDHGSTDALDTELGLDVESLTRQVRTALGQARAPGVTAPRS